MSCHVMYVCIYIFVERERERSQQFPAYRLNRPGKSINMMPRYGGTREWPTSNKPFSGDFGQVIPRHTFLIVFSIYNSLFLYVFLDVYIYIYYIYNITIYVSSNFIIFPMISPCFPFFHFSPETCPVQKCPRHQVQSSPAARSRRACGFRRRRPEADFQRSILQRMLGQRPQTCRRPWGDGWWNETNILREYTYIILLYIYIICILYILYIICILYIYYIILYIIYYIIYYILYIIYYILYIIYYIYITYYIYMCM